MWWILISDQTHWTLAWPNRRHRHKTADHRTRIACPSDDLFDTLDLMRRLYPRWPSHSLENVAIRLDVPNEAEHRALSDASWSKTCFWRC
jgi:DNA polymerase III epsilon subunit-like protein